MSIERTSPLKPINAVHAREENEAFTAKSRPAKSSSPNSASVTLSDAQARLMQPGSGDINQDRVEALKIAIGNGELKVNTGKIANAIIFEARRLLLDK